MNYLTPLADAVEPQAERGPLGMSLENWNITKLLLKIGLVGTAISIPVGVWALKRWPDSPIVPAIILTAIGLVVKEVMISHGSEEEPLVEELHQNAQTSMAGYRRVPVRAPSF